ncbi:hypothetical protein GGF37_001152 [Kickxella alabastrina]|nr:hypothetical protein GGF37_001152 [Kickxella alabastrina]
MVIPAGVAIQFCYGSLYAWSIFNAPINKLLGNGVNKTGAENTFYITLGILGFTGALFGPWIESHHPRKSGTIGIALFFAGHLTAALALFVRMMSLLYFGYGVIGGIGLGVGYVSTVEAVSKWWPKARGAASGSAVMGFGGGALAFSYINKALVDYTSLPKAFVILGSATFIVMLFCLQFIAPPPPDHNINGIIMTESSGRPHFDVKGNLVEVGKMETGISTLTAEIPPVQMPLGEVLRSRDFWLLYISFIANIVFCLVILSNLPNMINRLFGKDSKEGKESPLPAHIAVSIESGFNMLGRVLIGSVSDKVGRKSTFLVLLLTQVAVLICVPITIHTGNFWGFLVLVWLATLCYGGGFGMIPAFLSDMFGISNMSSCHGIILTGWSITSISGGLAFTNSINAHINHGGKPYDTDIYFVNFMWMLALVVIGFVCCLFVRASIRDRMFPALPGQIMRMRIFGRVFRIQWIYKAAHSEDLDYMLSPVENRRRRMRFGNEGRRLRWEYMKKEDEQIEWEEYLALRAAQTQLMREPAI